jgi:hypothetical protein
MLARQRIARPQLGEDGDHDLAQVLARGLVGLGEGLLKRLKGGGAVVAVPGGERLLEAAAVA